MPAAIDSKGLSTGIVLLGGKWTLGSWCLLRAAFRDFCLDRMSEVEALSYQLEPTDQMNLKTCMSHQAASWSEVHTSTDIRYQEAAPNLSTP